MKVLIISERLTTTSQIRFALSGVGHSCVTIEFTTVADAVHETRRIGNDCDVVFLAMPRNEDDGIQLIQELRPDSKARIVVVGVAEDPHQILRALHEGADDYLDEAGDLQSQVRTVLDRVQLTSHEGATKPDGQLIAVTGAVGGAGATLVAANLAALRARDGEPCGLIDLSGGFGELATLFGLQPRHTMTELCSGSDSLDLEMLRNSISKHACGVHLIASGPVTSEWEFDSNHAVRRVVDTSQRLLPTVVLDLTRRAPYSHELLSQCDLIILLTCLDFRAACTTHRLLRSWEERNIAMDRVAVVANQVRRKGELGDGMFETILTRKIDLQLVDDPLSANLAVNCGHPAVLESPHSPLANGLHELDRLVSRRLTESGATLGSPEGRTRSPIHRFLKRCVAGLC